MELANWKIFAVCVVSMGTVSTYMNITPLLACVLSRHLVRNNFLILLRS
jgi:hypothetical protein